MNPDDPDKSWYFENRQHKIPIDEHRIQQFLSKLASDFTHGAEFTIVVSSDDALRRANRRFRNISRTTDVLSFPDGEDGRLGDLLISASRAACQANEYGHSLEEEIQVLALHGLLHLQGFDHTNDNGEMQKVEEQWRRKYKLPSGLIERSTG